MLCVQEPCKNRARTVAIVHALFNKPNFPPKFSPMSGKFQGVMAATTPSGSTSV
jgi:hypothetical protein